MVMIMSYSPGDSDCTMREQDHCEICTLLSYWVIMLGYSVAVRMKPLM